MLKVSQKTTPVDQNTHPDVTGAKVWQLINATTVGSIRGMLLITEFAPGGKHTLHRHANSEQASFLLSGKGEHLTEHGPVIQEAGDAIYVSRNEWHGFRNIGEQPAKLVSLFGTAGALSQAGYESYSGRLSPRPNPVIKRVRLRDLQSDTNLDENTGFIGLGVYWLITRETVGAENIVLGASTFEPGGVHEHHRHPNGDEILFILEGGGKHLTPNGEAGLGAGEIAFIPANEYHGFDNPPSVITRTIFGYFGPGSLAEAGYEVRPGG